MKALFPNSENGEALIFCISFCKDPYANQILIPQGSTGSSTFFMSNESPHFSRQIHNILEVIAENVPISRIPIFISYVFS